MLHFTDFILYPFILPLKNSTIHDEILFKNGRDEVYENKNHTKKILQQFSGKIKFY